MGLLSLASDSLSFKRAAFRTQPDQVTRAVVPVNTATSDYFVSPYFATSTRVRVFLTLAAILAWNSSSLFAQQSAEGPSPAPTAPAPPSGGQIEMNFQNIEISNFLSTMSRAFSIPFVWDDQAVRGRITLQSIRKYSRVDAYRLFETVLAMQGYTTVRGEGSPVVQVVPLAEAARLPTPINPEVSAALGGNEFVTRIITLQHAEPEVVKNTLAPLMSKTAATAVYGPAGALILADTEDNLRRYQRIIDQLDVAGTDSEFAIIHLKFASARRLAPILSSLITGSEGGGPEKPPGAPRARPQAAGAAARKAVILSDDRTNLLIVSADPTDVRAIRRLVEVLDIPAAFDEGGFKIYRLKHASASNLASILREVNQGTSAPPNQPGRPRKEGEGGLERSSVMITADRPTNALIVFAPAEVMETFDRLVEALDISGRAEDSNFKIYKLHYASAEELARIFQQFKQTGAPLPAGREKGTGEDPRSGSPAGAMDAIIAADRPTNSLIVFGPPSLIQTFDTLVAALDVPGRVEPSTFKVYRLQHASADNLSKVLSEVKQGASAVGKEPSQTGPRNPPGTPAQPGQPSGAGRGLPGLAANEMNITADKATNSLIVFGTPEQIRTMDAIIEQLDIRRPQVYVEALIMELTLEKSLQLGINWQASARVGNSVVGGGFPNSQPQTLPDVLGQGNGAALGIIGDEIQFQGQKFTSFSAFIQATRQDLDLNILANPQILTLDNEEAQINVSQVIPVSAKVVRDASLQTTTEFEFKDVGVILSITPQITGTDKVLLKISQESSSVAAQQVQSSQNQTAITTLKRTINTKVLIDDGATMAIGGLIQDNQILTVSKVPCLGDIPVLGWFFKSRSEGVRKTNLIVFLRPHVINTREDLEKITNSAQSRYDKSRQPGGNVENQLRESFNLPPKPIPPEKIEEKPSSE